MQTKSIYTLLFQSYRSVGKALRRLNPRIEIMKSDMLWCWFLIKWPKWLRRLKSQKKHCRATVFESNFSVAIKVCDSLFFILKMFFTVNFLFFLVIFGLALNNFPNFYKSALVCSVLRKQLSKCYRNEFKILVNTPGKHLKWRWVAERFDAWTPGFQEGLSASFLLFYLFYTVEEARKITALRLGEKLSHTSPHSSGPFPLPFLSLSGAFQVGLNPLGGIPWQKDHYSLTLTSEACQSHSILLLL